MKDFLLIANQNAATYKELFPHIQDNKVRFGYGFKGGVAYFISDYKDIAVAACHKEGMIRVSGVVWLTTLQVDRKKKLTLTKTYNEKDYPTYDNYPAIEVKKVKDIPIDYNGLMGVPITFLNYYPNDFIIKDLRRPQLNGKTKYPRLLIKRTDN